MFHVKDLSVAEKLTLENMRKYHSSHAPRTRAHAILLSHVGFSVKDISMILGVCRQTPATWIHAWEERGICGLLDNPRSGRPCILSEEQKNQAIEQVNQSPRSLKSALVSLSEKWGEKLISYSSLKGMCKKAKLCWKRIRKSLKSKRDANEFLHCQQQLLDLLEKEKQGEIDVFYYDESGFSLDPCIPYAWQPIGKNIEIPCAKSKRLNVLGFMKKDCTFQSMMFEGSINSSVVIGCIDYFLETRNNQPTAIILDNASIHTSDEFKSCIDDWKEKGLVIISLSKYSPELNLIEILWRKIKYEWMPFLAYESFSALEKNLYHILANIGKAYTIEFA